MEQKPQVGTAPIIVCDDRVLLMKRKGPHGAGTWSPPGGHLDFGETLEACAAREAKEEVGVDMLDIRFRCVTNDVCKDEGKHYNTVWMEGKPVGEPGIVAEQEVAEIGSFAWDELPEPLFLPLENFSRGNSYPPK